MAIAINRLSDALGAEMTGVDLSGGVEDATFAAIRQALVDHQVIVVRDQALPADAHIALSRRFGDVEEHDNRRYWLDGHAEILVLSNDLEDGEPIGVPDAGDAWHSDLSFKPRPALCTLLHAVALPRRGGDTEFTNLYAAYETLPADTKARIAGLRGIHTVNKLRNPRVEIAGTRPDAARFYAEQAAKRPDTTHALVRTHPETGRTVLYASPRFTIGIEGMDDAEAQPLLDTLFAHQLSPEFLYRHHWRLGDLVIWDNRSVNHRACGGYAYPDIRTMHRTTVLVDAAD
jgi:taurine dioxygenase